MHRIRLPFFCRGPVAELTSPVVAPAVRRAIFDYAAGMSLPSGDRRELEATHDSHGDA